MSACRALLRLIPCSPHQVLNVVPCLRVVSVRSRFFSRRVDLRLWGRAPGSIQ
jgi:hypothetical protein